MNAPARAAVVASLVTLTACGPIDATLAQLADSTQGPAVVLTETRPRATFRIAIRANDEAVPTGTRVEFGIDSQKIQLGASRAGAPVDIRLRRRGVGPAIEIVDGRCRRECLGTFDLTFVRSVDAPTTVAFDWTLAAFVNYQATEVPADAVIDAVVQS